MRSLREASPTRQVSLARRIDELEQRLQRRHRIALQRRQAMALSLRRRASSPLTLLLAAGVGFAVHRITLLQRFAPQATAGISRFNALLSSTIRSISLLGALVSLLPASPSRRPAAPDPHKPE